MSTKRISLAAVVAVAALAACSDPSVAPTAPAYTPSTPTLAVAGTTTGITSTPVPSELRVCKLGNVSGTFTVTRTFTTPYTPGSPVSSIVGANFVVAAGACAVVVEDDAPSGSASNVTVTEQGSDLVGITGSSIQLGGAPVVISPNPVNGATYVINSIHGIALVFTNNHVTSGCTFTKGWYRNHGSNSVTAADGRTKAQNQAIMDATPGKPGSVTWGVNNDPNDLLNLYQQLLTAIFNGGQAGPASVQAAITAALAGTGGTGLNITTTLNQTQISDLISALDAFNEGTLPNWPHCPD